MSNYFMNQYMQGGTDNFLREQLVPYLERRFNINEAEENDNDVQDDELYEKELSDASTETSADLPWKLDTKLNFDPIQLFYNTVNNQPSVKEAVGRARAEEQSRHERHMEETLLNLNKEHRDTLESVNKCLNAERTAREIEKSALETQIEALNDKVSQLEAAKTCVICAQQFNTEGDKYNNELAELEQTNLDKQYRIQELEEQFAELLNDYRGAEEQYEMVLARSVQAEEELKLYEILIKKLEMLNSDIFNGNPNNEAASGAFGIMTELLGNIGGNQSQSSSGSSISQSDIEMQRRKQQEEFNKYQAFANTFEATAEREYDRINQHDNKMPPYFEYYKEQEQKEEHGVGEMEFTKDTTPPAVPHVEYPPSLLELYEEEQNMQENQPLNIVTDTKTPQVPVELSGKVSDLVMSQELKNKLLYSEEPDPDKENPDKPDRNAICVRNSNIEEIEALDSFSSSQGTSPNGVNAPEESQKPKTESPTRFVPGNAEKPLKKSPGRLKASIEEKVDESMSNDFDEESRRTLDDDFDTEMSVSTSPAPAMPRLASVARFDELGREIPVDKKPSGLSRANKASSEASEKPQQSKMKVLKTSEVLTSPNNKTSKITKNVSTTENLEINKIEEKKLPEEIRGYKVTYDNSGMSNEEKDNEEAHNSMKFSENVFGNTETHESNIFEEEEEIEPPSLRNSFSKVLEEGIKDESFEW